MNQSSHSQSAAEDQKVLSGIIEKIVFHNEENGYTVCTLVPDPASAEEFKSKFGNSKKVFSCVGVLVSPTVGQHIQLKGKWTKHPKYGEQFAFSTTEEIYPTTQEGIQEYLTSGTIDGLGVSLAKRIVEKFGDETFTILDAHPKRLLEVKGLGAKSYEKIIKSWQEHTLHRNLSLFLQPFGISASLCARILRILGEDAIEKIRSNPYCLSRSIRGISFERADMIAQGLGFPKDSPFRVEAAILAVLAQDIDSGNVYTPKEVLCKKLANFIEIAGLDVDELLDMLVSENQIVIELLPDSSSSAQNQVVYLRRFYTYETEVAEQIHRIVSSPKSLQFSDPDVAACDIVDHMSITLAPEQKEAVRMAAATKMMILTGGPGTGKTTIIKAIIQLFATKKASILLAAPTGRAARRMQETTGHSAKTIHRLLEVTESGFENARDMSNPLSCDVLIIDEASMIDIALFYHLMLAVPLGCTVIMVGDIYQLPSVGPGSVLSDLIDSKVISVVKLEKIFRQSAESAIVRYAHLINQGIIPDLAHDTEKKTDFYFIEENDPAEAAKTITDLVKRRLPNYYHFSTKDIQVLSPMRGREVGITALNIALQEALNPNGQSVTFGKNIYKVSDKVMQLRNNYEKQVFNGDIGTITSINDAQKTLLVTFDEEAIEYTFSELEELAVAYAISIHKSQGSEYPAVVIPLMSCHWWMLQRNLLYTAITRGKKLVVLLGERSAFFQAIRNTSTITRLTALSYRLRVFGQNISFM